MAQDWQNWLGMAERELEDARVALADGLFQMVAFFSHQIAEASLKALWIREADGLPPRTHDLLDMAEQLQAPEVVLGAARDLNTLYSDTRYPDVANGNPARNYDKSNAIRALAGAEEVFEWCSRRLRN